MESENITEKNLSGLLLEKARKRNNITDYKQVNDSLYILKLAKHISMLIR